MIDRMPGRHALAALLGPSGLRVVVYHDIASAPGPCVEGLDVNAPPEVFVQHLDHYERDYSVVDLDTVLRGRLPKRPLLITFDDGYRSVVETAAPELRRRGLPAVLFATADVIGGRRLMLDNVLCYLSNTVGMERLARALGDGAATVDTSLAAMLERAVAPLPYRDRLALARTLVAEFGIDEEALLDRYRLYLEPADVPRLVGLGFEIGCHTASHVHCRRLGPAEARQEIAGAASRLAELAGRPVRAFSYPYGSEADATPVAREALSAGGLEIEFLVGPRTNGRRHLGQSWYRVPMEPPGPRSPFVRLEVRPRVGAVKRRLNHGRSTGNGLRSG